MRKVFMGLIVATIAILAVGWTCLARAQETDTHDWWDLVVSPDRVFSCVSLADFNGAESPRDFVAYYNRDGYISRGRDVSDGMRTSFMIEFTDPTHQRPMIRALLLMGRGICQKWAMNANAPK